MPGLGTEFGAPSYFHVDRHLEDRWIDGGFSNTRMFVTGSTDAAVVFEPTSMLLLGTGLAILAKGRLRGRHK
jgi:hypothetical protein